MSNAKKAYRESYRFVRCLMQGNLPPVPIISSFQSHVMPFTNALISWDNRHIKPSGWVNNYRYWQWRNTPRIFPQDNYSVIPF